MRQMIFVLVLGLLTLFPLGHVFCQSSPRETPATGGTVPDAKTGPDGEAGIFSITAGYRVDDLKWSIAGNSQGNSPNILSELTWSDITILQLNLNFRTIIEKWVLLRGHLDYGFVISGDNQDSDYQEDNRSHEFSRSFNGVDGNRVWDGSIGAGPRFSFLGATLVASPLVGYAISEQDFNIVDGHQVLTAPPASTTPGPIDGLDSRYQAHWKGPWIGVDLFYTIPVPRGPFRTMGVGFSGEYHWVDYDADANWNLRTDLQHPVSFSHDADGSGLLLEAAFFIETHSHWGFKLGMNMVEMVTDAGSDRIYFADGTSADTRLNEVRWRTFMLTAGLSYRF